MLAWSENGIGWMGFNNPDKLNAMGVAISLAMNAAMHTFRDDRGVSVVVMKGAGDRAFVSGADLGATIARNAPMTIRAIQEVTKDPDRFVQACFAFSDYKNAEPPSYRSAPVFKDS